MTDRCPATRLSGEQCSLDAGHPSSHIHFMPSGAIAWMILEPAHPGRAAAGRVDSDDA